MKIIDLLNKIANGEEVPKKIKFHYGIYELDNNGFNIDYYFKDDERWLFFDKWALTNNLNDEVEILEEEKKIPEKLDLDTYAAIGTEVDRDLIIKINEIIDYFKSKGDE